MRRNTAVFIIVIILIILILAVTLSAGRNQAQHSQGALTIAGRVYDSDGENPGDGFEGTYAAVTIEHNGIRTTYEDSDGLERDNHGDYWYDVTMPSEQWEPGDRYWVMVDGTGWGDLNAECVAHDNPEESSWVADSVSESQDVNTVDIIRVVNGGSPPGMVFFIIIGVIVFVVAIIVLMLLGPKSGSIPPRTRF